MKSLVLFALSLGLLTASSALADPPHRGNPPPHHAARPATRVTVHRTTTVHRSAPRTTIHRTVVRRTAPVRHVTVRRTIVHRTAMHPVVTHRNVTVHRNVHRNVRNVNMTAHGRVTVAHYHRVYRAPHRYHIRAWAAPRGFGYRRFAIGERVPSVFLSADFFLADYTLYGLDAPPPEYVWVRDGSDAVLVDRYTGEVIEVVYDVFY